MSDETTLLPCPFCGGEIPVPTRRYMSVLICPTCNAYGPGNSDMTNDELIAAWNTRATHSALTAEQVREAVEASTWAETSTIREFNDSSWQAIADELNAELGSGTCEMVLMWSDYEDGECYKCSKCGDFAFTCGGEPRFCPECGAKVVGK